MKYSLNLHLKTNQDSRKLLLLLLFLLPSPSDFSTGLNGLFSSDGAPSKGWEEGRKGGGPSWWGRGIPLCGRKVSLVVVEEEKSRQRRRVMKPLEEEEEKE